VITALCRLLTRAAAAAAAQSWVPWGSCRALLASVPFWLLPITSLLLQQLAARSHARWLWRWREQLLLLHRMGGAVYYSSLLLPGSGVAEAAAGAGLLPLTRPACAPGCAPASRAAHAGASRGALGCGRPRGAAPKRRLARRQMQRRRCARLWRLAQMVPAMQCS
jgi:hypothetical protein